MKAPKAFTNTVRLLPFPPPDVDQFWGVWQDRAKPRRIGREAMAILTSAYPGFLRVLVFGGIVGVESADYIRQFTLETIVFTSKTGLDAAGPLTRWITSNVGYVAEPMKIITSDETVEQ